MTHRPRRQPPRLPNPSDRRYTSFKELGVASPRLEESETDDDPVHNNHDSIPDNHNHKDERSSAPTAAQSAKSKGEAQGGGAGAGKKQETKRKEGVKAEAGEREEQGRARSGSMRLVEWIMRTRSASSAP